MKDLLIYSVLLIVIYEVTTATNEILVFDYTDDLPYQIKTYEPDNDTTEESYQDKEEDSNKLTYDDLIRYWNQFP